MKFKYTKNTTKIKVLFLFVTCSSLYGRR